MVKRKSKFIYFVCLFLERRKKSCKWIPKWTFPSNVAFNSSLSGLSVQHIFLIANKNILHTVIYKLGGSFVIWRPWLIFVKTSSIIFIFLKLFFIAGFEPDLAYIMQCAYLPELTSEQTLFKLLFNLLKNFVSFQIMVILRCTRI